MMKSNVSKALGHYPSIRIRCWNAGVCKSNETMQSSGVTKLWSCDSMAHARLTLAQPAARLRGSRSPSQLRPSGPRVEPDASRRQQPGAVARGGTRHCLVREAGARIAADAD